MIIRSLIPPPPPSLCVPQLKKNEIGGRQKKKKVDVDENSESAEKYGIEAMPTLKFIKNGEVVGTITGADQPSIEAACLQYK